MLTEDPCPRHIIALHVGDGSRERAQQLWARSQKHQGATGQAPQRAVGESRWGTGPGKHPIACPAPTTGTMDRESLDLERDFLSVYLLRPASSVKTSNVH